MVHPYALAQDTELCRGAYRILETLGAGGFGITYRALDTNLERQVAIKEHFPYGCMRRGSDVVGGADYPESRRRFLEEARRLARFDHPGIVRVHAVFEENQAGYMVMELLDGEDLEQMVARRGCLPQAEALGYLRQAAQAVGTLHRAGLVHRDIKPSNLFLARGGRLVLLDFGAARSYLSPAPMTAMVTPGYAPPEQYRPDGTPGPWTDVYALAATFYHLVSASPPPDPIARGQGEALVAPSGVSGGVWKVLARSLSLSPDVRPQSMADLLACLDEPETEVTARLRGHRGPVNSVSFSADGELVASGSEDRTVRLWQPATGLCRDCLEGHSDWVNAVRFTGDGRLLTAGNDRQVLIWSDSRIEARLSAPAGVLCLELSGDGRCLAGGMWNGEVSLWELEGDGRRSLRVSSRGAVWAVALHPAGRLLAAAATPDPEIQLWNHRSCSVVLRLPGHRASVRSLAFRPDGTLLASASGDRTVRLWTIPDGRLAAVLEGHTDVVRWVRFSPDGRLLASASQDGNVRLWEAPWQGAVRVLEGHGGGLYEAGFSPDGRLLACACQDGTVDLLRLV